VAATTPSCQRFAPRCRRFAVVGIGKQRNRAQQTAARSRPARLALPLGLACVGRSLHRPLDSGQDGRPGRARERRAPRSLRRALAAHVLAHWRDARTPRPPKTAAPMETFRRTAHAVTAHQWARTAPTSAMLSQSRKSTRTLSARVRLRARGAVLLERCARRVRRDRATRSSSSSPSSPMRSSSSCARFLRSRRLSRRSRGDCSTSRKLPSVSAVRPAGLVSRRSPALCPGSGSTADG
jgi:hypothetical protein